MIFYTFIKVIPIELQQKTVQYIKNNCFMIIISHSSCVHNLSCILHICPSWQNMAERHYIKWPQLHYMYMDKKPQVIENGSCITYCCSYCVPFCWNVTHIELVWIFSWTTHKWVLYQNIHVFWKFRGKEFNIRCQSPKMHMKFQR